MNICEFKKEHHYIDFLASKKPHEILNNVLIEVYCEDIIYDGKKTWFWLFNNGEYIGNPISFPCDVPYEDKVKIATDMINELISVSDFTDLDLELEGKVPCEEFRGIYSDCKQCDLYKKEKDGCLGGLYSIPNHMNYWGKTEDKWKKVYGENTENHKLYITNRMISNMNDFINICGDDKNLINKVLKYAKEHRANKHKKLFK